MSIDSIVNLAARKIGEVLVDEARLLYGVEDQVESLREELSMMTSYLIDMDEEGGDERSRNAIKQIRKIAYDAEDAIESFVLENSSSGNNMEDLFKKYACFCGSILSAHQIGTEIEAIKVRIAEATKRRKDYLGPNGITSDAPRARVRRPMSYAHHTEDHVVGLDDDINNLVRVLITADDEVVSIVGMGGSGKTTLARKLFNHECVKKYFDCVAWVSISEQWIIKDILAELLRKARGESKRASDVLSLQEIVDKLQLYLEGKRYLIVLDDVWQKQALADILPTLPNQERKFIVTTRKQAVVDFPDLKCFIHEPRRLSEGESWELFSKIALIHNSTTLDIALFESLGREMLEKCDGLPLAVIALAGILGKKETFEEWEKIKKAVSARIMECGRGTSLYGSVNEMLALSYTDLPHELKPCFLYLAVFKDSEISAGQLVRMWIAEGFIPSDDVHGGDTVEDVARRYLDELIHRCVVQNVRKSYKGKVIRIRIHDLVRDLCIKKAKEQDFLKISTFDSPDLDARVTELRRTAIHLSDKEYVPFPTKSKHLRSLVYEGNGEIRHFQTPNLGLQPIHQSFRLLRVLSLESIYSSNGTLPAGIGNLIHLRYLYLRSTNIKQLPSSIRNLHNLLTLDYRNDDFNSRDVFRIPDVIWKLKGLTHLYLPSCFIVDHSTVNIVNLRLDTLKQLQTLWGIEGGNWMLEELPRLSQRLRKLFIKGISSSGQLEAAFQCPSIMLDRLLSLQLDWDSTSTSQGEVVTLKNSEAITHCQHLRRLSLRGRIEDAFSFPAGVMKLELMKTQFEADSSLAALGKLPNLAILVLYRGAYSGAKWSCCAGDFPMLKELRLTSLDNLEEWSIEKGAMPQLRVLTVFGCARMRRISEGLKFVTTLQELEFWQMSDEFIQRCKERGEDAHIIQHVPQVKYRNLE